MTKKNGSTKSRKSDSVNVVKQMDSWIQNETKLALLITTSLVFQILFGRLVAHQEEEGLFLFDAHGGFCRVLLLPTRYDCSLGSQNGSVSVTFKDDSAEELSLTEDIREAQELPGAFHAPGQELQPAG